MSHHQHHQHHPHHQHHHPEQHHHAESPPNPLLEKLRAIAKPRIWGPVGVISFVGLFVWQVSEHPDWYQVEIGSEVSTDGLTAEERAIAAEIDSSGLLAEQLHLGKPEDFNFFNTPIQGGEDVLEAARQPDSDDRPTVTLPEPELPTLPTFLPQQPSQPATGNPFAPTPASPPSQTAPAARSNPLGMPNFGTAPSRSNDPTETKDPTLPASPLQAAMDQYLLQSQPESTAPTQETTADPIDATGSFNPISVATPTSQPAAGDVPYTGIPLPASAPAVQVPEPTWVVPRTVTAIDGTAAPVQTPATNPYQTNTALPQPVPQAQQPNARPAPVLPPNPANPYGQYNFTGTNPYARSPNSGNLGTSGNPSYQTATPNPQNYVVGPSNLNRTGQNPVVRQQTPFTAPRRTPGRTIGGGRINTFSNP
ncbi:hypothetical protein [Lyngbya sp. CCY1209]|uniref:hypothetical protein n=1 Tax=Lyngbya sp. CCY1209 TaxID=2886103 RepID=UPI002D209B0C|nr:hypothetical protein [Lyngbya sp. CCY1209]MEB3884557.1 hypothetical protein [Lyngbya sp. CCY1209]